MLMIAAAAVVLAVIGIVRYLFKKRKEINDNRISLILPSDRTRDLSN